MCLISQKLIITRFNIDHKPIGYYYLKHDSLFKPDHAQRPEKNYVTALKPFYLCALQWLFFDIFIPDHERP